MLFRSRVDEHVWTKDWVVHSQPVGNGEHAFRSLAPSILRVAISNNRILTLEDGHVTCTYKDSATAQVTCSTVRAEDVSGVCFSTCCLTDASRGAMTAC